MPRSRILVLGLGNLLMGDEGVGIHAVQELAKRPLPANVDVVDGGTPGIDLLSLLDGYDRVVIVDAVDAGLEPGAILRFTSEEVESGSGALPLSLHQADVSEVLQLARYIGRALPPIVIMGMQPDEVGWGTELSQVADARLEPLLEAIVDDLSIC